MRSMTIFGILLATLATVAQASQLTHPFHIPSRPVGLPKAHERVVKFGQGKGNISPYRDDMFQHCPAVSKIVTRIYDRLVTTNQLEQFSLMYQGMRVQVSCDDVLPKGSGWGTRATKDGTVEIAASIASYSKSEDEMAFIIAHEMAHIVLGHNELDVSVFDLGTEDMDLNKAFAAAENDADRLGAILVANSGYDPRAAIDALWHLAQFVEPILSWSPFIIYAYGFGSHGTLAERQSHVEDGLSQVAYKGNPSRTRSVELNEAKAEHKRLRAKLGK
jgi:hypothetical protein